MGIVGAGFVGPHHIDAVRRLGYVDIVGVAGSSQACTTRSMPPRSRRGSTRHLGHRANVIVEAILESAAKGSVWTKVNY